LFNGRVVSIPSGNTIQGQRRGIQRGDLLLAAVVALIAFSVYLRTLFPGVGGGGDSVKFQYVGSVLGTPHPPGYPLYVLISYVFAQVPAESLAWRINAMSAFFAAAAVFLCVLILARLDVRRPVAAAIALALAFDRGLWAYAVRAEVYSVAGALVAAILFCALRWQATGRRRDLYLMVAAFALSLGNHLTVTTLVPGLLAFVAVTDRRAIRLRTTAVSALIVVAGLAQYGFIVLRTLQNAPYIEARATNLRELLDVMRASRYSYQVFAFSPYELLVERVPYLWQVCLTELNPLGMLLVCAGLGALIVRRAGEGVLLVLGAAGIVFLTLNVDADVEGFLVPAFVLLWVVAGVGLDVLWRLAARAGRYRSVVMAVMIAAAITLPALQLARNYRVNDHHRRTYEIRYLDALFDRLEPRAAIVTEAYAIDQLVLYKLIGERADRGRAIELIPRQPAEVRRRAASGYAVYAFSGAHGALEQSGFRFESIQLAPRSPAGPPIDMTPIPLFRLVRAAACHDVGNAGWQDVTDVARDGRLIVRIDNYRPFDSRLVLYVGRRTPEAGSPLLAVSQGPERPVMNALTFAAGTRELAAALQRDGLTEARVLTQHATVQRVELDVNDRGQFSWSAIGLGGSPDVVMVRASVDLDNPRRATVCGWSGRDFFETGVEEQVPLTARGETWLGLGWHAAERSTAGADFRWTSAREAEVLVPLARAGTVRVRLRAEPFVYPGSKPATIALTVNAAKLPAREMRAGGDVYEWMVPADVWREGFNRLTLSASATASPSAVGLSGDTRSLGVAVSELSFHLVPDSSPAPR
jgi:hypothetical protein